MNFTSTPRGARLARRLVSNHLDVSGHPYACATNETVTLIAAELAANAVRHGHVPGRDFRLSVTVRPERIRVEVTDPLGERQPGPDAGREPGGWDAESGRGLLVVSQLASRWSVTALPDAPGKTVWAEVALP